MARAFLDALLALVDSFGGAFKSFSGAAHRHCYAAYSFNNAAKAWHGQSVLSRNKCQFSFERTQKNDDINRRAMIANICANSAAFLGRIFVILTIVVTEIVPIIDLVNRMLVQLIFHVPKPKMTP